jgi:Concanavalin A-like lectin/glucanases superfamily
VQEKEEALSKRGAILAGIALAACLVLAPSAGAATLLGDYQFQGTRASSGPGPDLTGVNDVGTYQTESVMGTTRQVLAFAQGTGLQMSPTGLSTAEHSVVMTFRLFDDDGNYNRILDWSHGTSDNGLYDIERKVSYYRTLEEVESPSTVFGSNSYSTLAVTVADTPSTRVFVNGTPALESPHQEGIIGNALRFFVDNSSGGTPGEESAGAVSCIRVFSGVLSDSEISAIGASPDCAAHPAPAQPPAQSPGTTKKKCKKHKRKHHSAESAKKKKCKKKKKR